MPAGVTTVGDQKVVAAVAGFSFLLIVLSIVVAARGDEAEVPTTYSVASGGAKAAYLLLGSSGYSVQRWERSVVDLNTGGGATLVIAQPEATPTADERAAVRRFMEAGGRVVATGVSGALFLPEHRVLPDPIAGITWRRLSSRSTSTSSITRAAPAITLAPEAYWEDHTPAIPMYGDDSRTRVITYAVGRGDAIWWASATPLTNAGLREPGNLEFFLACLGDASHAVYFDEYSHGHRQASSSAVAGSDVRWLGLQLLFVVVTVLVTYSRRSGPVLAAAVENRLSPLEFVRTLGSIYERAGAASVAVDIACQRFRYQVTRGLAIRTDASAEELDRAIRARSRVDDPELAALLRSCDAARSDATLSPSTALKLTQSLFDWSVRARGFGLRLGWTSQKERA
jgi:hypothetical protein